MNKYAKITCIICGKKVIRSILYCLPKTCSMSCKQRLVCKNIKDKKGKYKINSLAMRGVKNPMWKGNKVGYHALHSWIKSRIKIQPSFNFTF